MAKAARSKVVPEIEPSAVGRVQRGVGDRSVSSMPSAGVSVTPPARVLIGLQRTIGNRATLAWLKAESSPGRSLVSSALDQTDAGGVAHRRLSSWRETVTDPLPLPILPVQRRALDWSGLNVVGEYHDESDGRRGTEKRLAERKDLQYFEEHQFLANDGDGDFKTKQTADPVGLRVGQRAHTLGTTVQLWVRLKWRSLDPVSASASHQASDSAIVSSPEADSASPKSGATTTLTAKEDDESRRNYVCFHRQRH